MLSPAERAVTCTGRVDGLELPFGRGSATIWELVSVSLGLRRKSNLICERRFVTWDATGDKDPLARDGDTSRANPDPRGLPRFPFLPSFFHPF